MTVLDIGNQITFELSNNIAGVGWGVLPYMSYIGMCSPKGYGLLAVWVWNRVLILAIFV